jgi:hypothetical protein
MKIIAGKALFPLGQIVSTPGAIDACSNEHRIDSLARHASGDWGVVCKADAARNDAALCDGTRVFSAYPLDPSQPSIMAPIGNHSFRATGITAYLANGGTLEHAQSMAAHESAHDQALRPHQGAAHPGRSGADQVGLIFHRH